MSRTLRTAVLALLTLAACSRDLELPEGGVPTLRAMAPSAAWGGQWLALTGAGFDRTPASNRVQFASGVEAPAERLENGVLYVRVPAGAGNGPVSVANARGASAKFGSFTYRGRGELDRGQVVESRALLHEPAGILAATGNTFFLQSKLWGGLVNLTDSSFDGDGATGGVAIDGGAALAWIDRSDAPPCPLPATPPQIVRYDVVAKTHACVAAPAEQYVYLAAVAGTPNRLAVVSSDQSTVKLLVLNAATLAVISASRTVGGSITDVDAVADAGGQRIVMVARQASSGPTGLVVAFPGGSPADAWIAPPAQCSLAGYFATQPLVVAKRGPGPNFIAVAVAEGGTVAEKGDLCTADLGIASYTGAISLSIAPIPLNFTVGRPSGLAADGQYVAVSKGTEGLVLGIDMGPATPVVKWSVPESAPGPATGANGYFSVASGGSNDALDIEAATGIARARWDFGLFPGRNDQVAGSWVSRPGAVAWCGPPGCASPMLVISTTYPDGVLFRPVGASSGSLGYTSAELGGVATVAGAPWSWSEPAVTAGWVEDPAGNRWAVNEEVLRVLPDATGAWVVHASGLSRMEGGVEMGLSFFPTTATRAIQPIVRPDGMIVAAWTDGTDWYAATWSRQQVLANTDADAATLPVEADLLFIADGESWLVVSGPSSPSYINQAYRLIGNPIYAPGNLPEVIDVDTNTGGVYWTVAVSPNGRTLVRQTSGGLQVRRADPRANFPILSEIPIDGVLTGVTFNEAGDTAWAITRSPERVLTLQ